MGNHTVHCRCVKSVVWLYHVKLQSQHRFWEDFWYTHSRELLHDAYSMWDGMQL